MLKWFAGLTAVAMGLAVATAFSRSAPEVPAIKGDRLDIDQGSLGCPKFEWPYGCQWDAPKTRRAEQPVPATRNHQKFRSRVTAGAKARRIAITRSTAGQVSTR